MSLDSTLRQSADPKAFAASYMRRLGKLLAELDSSEVAAFLKELDRARTKGHTLFIVGNGGSAATASHMANDFNVGIRPSTSVPPLRALALTDNVALMTAVANDFGYEHIFTRQLEAHYRKGDALLAISASGNSPNVVAAAEWVKAKGGTVTALVGFDGGRLKSLADVCVWVRTPKGDYGPVEDVHMALDHLAYTWLKHTAAKP